MASAGKMLPGGLVECPRCGTQLNPRGLATHQRTNACAADTRARELRDAGWRRVPDEPMARLLTRLGVPVQRAATAFYPGGKRGVMQSQPWVHHTIMDRIDFALRHRSEPGFRGLRRADLIVMALGCHKDAPPETHWKHTHPKKGNSNG